MNRSTIAVVFLASTLVAQDHEKATWYADFDEAVAAAKKADKDLLVDFTGSDWCGWCVRLHQEVFEHAEFERGVEPHFVLVALDFPRGEEAKAKVPNPERNGELQLKYGVRGFPTILLMTADGEVYGRTGYQPGGPGKYVESLDEMRTTGKRDLAEIKELVDKFEAGDGASRDAVLGLAIDKLATMAPDAVGIDKLAAIVKTGVDSTDPAVMERAVVALLESGQAGDAVLAKAVELDPKNEKGMFEKVVRARMMAVASDETAKAFLAALDQLVTLGAKDSELFEGMVGQAARWSQGPLRDPAGAKRYATILKEKAKDPSKYEKLFEDILGKKD